jgi:hypothetical protein
LAISKIVTPSAVWHVTGANALGGIVKDPIGSDWNLFLRRVRDKLLKSQRLLASSESS